MNRSRLLEELLETLSMGTNSVLTPSVELAQTLSDVYDTFGYFEVLVTCENDKSFLISGPELYLELTYDGQSYFISEPEGMAIDNLAYVGEKD